MKNALLLMNSMVHYDREVIKGITDGFKINNIKVLFHVITPSKKFSFDNKRWDYIIADLDKPHAINIINSLSCKNKIGFTSKSSRPDVNFSTITTDNDKLIALALSSFKKRRIKHVHFYSDNHDKNKPWTQSRYSSFKKSISHLQFNEIQDIQSALDSGCHPIGVVCSCDRAARKLIQKCIQTNIEIPNKLFVLGVDHDIFEKHLSPIDFPSINQDIDFFGKQIAACLLRRRHNNESFDQFSLNDDSFPYSQPKEIQLACFYMESNIQRKINIDEIAKQCHVSRKKLDLLFLDQYLMTAHAYFTQIKIEKAQTLLSTTELNISTISMECGFELPNYFYKIFKKKTQMTPDEYRSINKAS